MVTVHDLRETTEVGDVIKEAMENGYELPPGKFSIAYRQIETRFEPGNLVHIRLPAIGLLSRLFR